MLATIAGQPVAHTAADLRAWVADRRRQGQTVALVPTMGALHRGHMALVQEGLRQADAVVLTIFVNPLQFGPNEDFSRYPRTLPEDCALCAANGVGLVFAPAADEVYPPGFATKIDPGAVASRWCGASRPGHFAGVATVVVKLLNLALADVALFGEKDWQQLQVISQVARDLDHPTRIVGVPTVREADGLALSSRNRYLDPDARERATAIARGLRQAQQDVAAGQRDAATLRDALAAAITTAGGRVDYVAIADPTSLEPVAHIDGPARALVAAFFGPARLIDNCPLEL